MATFSRIRKMWYDSEPCFGDRLINWGIYVPSLLDFDSLLQCRLGTSWEASITLTSGE